MEPKAFACPMRHSETSELTGTRQAEAWDNAQGTKYPWSFKGDKNEQNDERCEILSPYTR